MTRLAPHSLRARVLKGRDVRSGHTSMLTTFFYKPITIRRRCKELVSTLIFLCNITPYMSVSLVVVLPFGRYMCSKGVNNYNCAWKEKIYIFFTHDYTAFTAPRPRRCAPSTPDISLPRERYTLTR